MLYKLEVRRITYLPLLNKLKNIPCKTKIITFWSHQETNKPWCGTTLPSNASPATTKSPPSSSTTITSLACAETPVRECIRITPVGRYIVELRIMSISFLITLTTNQRVLSGITFYPLSTDPDSPRPLCLQTDWAAVFCQAAHPRSAHNVRVACQGNCSFQRSRVPPLAHVNTPTPPTTIRRHSSRKLILMSWLSLGMPYSLLWTACLPCPTKGAAESAAPRLLALTCRRPPMLS